MTLYSIKTVSTLLMSETKRNYIRRKKYLNDTYEKIKRALEFINLKGQLGMKEQEIQKQAMSHAQTIEAACWSPHLKLSAKEYEDIASMKTTELCQALSQQLLPSFSWSSSTPKPQTLYSPPKPSINIHDNDSHQIKRSLTPHSFPIPIVPRSAPTPAPIFETLGNIDRFDTKPEPVTFSFEDHTYFSDEILPSADRERDIIIDNGFPQLQDDVETQDFFVPFM